MSIATVSRVIHQNGRFSPATEKRVRDAMKELDFSPNLMAQGLHRTVMPFVGIIVPDLLDDTYALMIQAVQDHILASGYVAEVFTTKEDGLLAQQFVRKLASQNASGVIYVPDSRNSDVSIDFRGMPTVFFEREPHFAPPARSTQISLDNAACGRQAARLLLNRGARRIILLGDSLNISNHQQRMQAVRDELGRDSVEPCLTLTVDPQRTTEAQHAMDEALDDGCRADAVLCTSIRLTIGALTSLKNHNIGSDQVTVLGIGEHRLHKYGILNYLAVQEPIQEMADAAAQALMRMIASESDVPEIKPFQASLNI